MNVVYWPMAHGMRVVYTDDAKLAAELRSMPKVTKRAKYAGAVVAWDFMYHRDAEREVRRAVAHHKRRARKENTISSAPTFRGLAGQGVR